MPDNPSTQGVFLRARWENLLLITWAVPAALLRRRLPRGFEPDTREGLCFASLVGFDFRDTHVLGVPWPGHVNFPEVNLRFYVRRGSERGVMFVKEIVPMFATAAIARVLYNEPYVAKRMVRRRRTRDGELRFEHRFHEGRRLQRFAVVAADEPFIPGPESTEHFFKEHEFGYGIDHFGRTLRYRVEHPHWRVYPTKSIEMDFDFALTYGKEWGFLAEEKPFSLILAEGSAVTVGFPQVLPPANRKG